MATTMDRSYGWDEEIDMEDGNRRVAFDRRRGGDNSGNSGTSHVRRSQVSSTPCRDLPTLYAFDSVSTSNGGLLRYGEAGT